jgi:hypothetical protein
MLFKATKVYRITYYNNSTNSSRYISGYYDVNDAGNIYTAKSTLGWIFYITSDLISWKSKLQTIIA